MLRDIVRNISNGNDFVDGLTVGLVDERGEISAMYKGEAQNDVGCRTDVLSNIPKAMGMKMSESAHSPTNEETMARNPKRRPRSAFFIFFITQAFKVEPSRKAKMEAKMIFGTKSNR